MLRAELFQKGEQGFAKNGAEVRKDLQGSLLAVVGALGDGPGGCFGVAGQAYVCGPDAARGNGIFEDAVPVRAVVERISRAACVVHLDGIVDGAAEAEARSQGHEDGIAGILPERTEEGRVDVVQEADVNVLRYGGQFVEGRAVNGCELVLHPEDPFAEIEGARDGDAEFPEPVRRADGLAERGGDGLPGAVRRDRHHPAVVALDERSADVQEPTRGHAGSRLSGRSCGCGWVRHRGSR